MFFLLNVIFPIYVIGIPFIVVIGLLVGFLGEQFDFTDCWANKLSAKGKIQVTKFCLRDVPLWPLTMPVYAFFFLKKLRVKYSGWKFEANQEAVADLEKQVLRLQNSIEESKRRNARADKERKDFLDLTKSHR